MNLGIAGSMNAWPDDSGDLNQFAIGKRNCKLIS